MIKNIILLIAVLLLTPSLYSQNMIVLNPGRQKTPSIKIFTDILRKIWAVVFMVDSMWVTAIK